MFDRLLQWLDRDARRFGALAAARSREAEVLARAGRPSETRQLPDGSRWLEYSRQPEGHTNWRVTLDAGGRVQGCEQLLSAERLARVGPGLNEAEVLALLGPPGARRRYRAQSGDTLVWRHRARGTAGCFVVTLDAQDRVLSAAHEIDPRELDATPPGLA